MHLASNSPKPGRTLLVIMTAALLAAATTQCRMVTDNVVRPRQTATPAGDCISNCAKAANDLIRIESDLHAATVKACKSDPACLAQEETRHQAAVNAIQDQRKACQNSCHHQGGGGGGR